MKTNKDYTHHLGQRIKRAREQAGFTQEELADLIGISRTTIARYELGEIEPSLHNLAAIARQLQVRTDYLLGMDEKESPGFLELSGSAVKALQVFINEIRKD